MKQNPFGLHVMDFNVPDAEMWAYYAAARPAMTVILNNHLRAQQVKATYPEMVVVHRQYNANDPKWHTLITAEAWVEANRPFGSNGVVVACLNEPGGDFRYDAAYRDRLIDWLIAVMDAAKRAGIKLALPNWSVGNPHTGTIEDGGFDRLLRRVCAAGSTVYWSSHEYWHDDPVAEYPFTIGRHEFWTDRVAELGLPPLNLLLTEYGMDKGGGGGDGWHNQGISDEQYADQFEASRTKLEHKPPGAIYGFGEGFGWGSFNIAGSKVPALLEDYQEDISVSTIPFPTSGGVVGVVDLLPSPVFNLRKDYGFKPGTETPSGEDVGDLSVGDDIVYWIDPATLAATGGWAAVKVTRAKDASTTGKQGWVAYLAGSYAGKVRFLPSLLPPPGEYTITADQVDQLTKAAAEIRLAQQRAAAALADMTAQLTIIEDTLRGIAGTTGDGF